MTDSKADTRFWKKEGDDIANTLCSNARRIRSKQDYRRTDDLIHASLYGDVEMLGFAPSSYSKPVETKGQQLSLNIVRNMVGACKSRIGAKAKSKPSFMTKGGDWALSRRAKKIEKAVEGTFSDVKFDPKSMLAFRDGCIFGTGSIKWDVHYEAKRVICKRLLPGEFLIEDQEGLYGDEGVRTAYYSHWYDKVVLAEIYPEFEEEIMNAQSSEEDEPEYGYDATSDQVLVREAWRLPSWRGAKDGMWARCINGKLLAQKPHKRDYFPVASWRWDDSLAGVYGKGLAFELRGLQLEINDILDEMSDMLRTVKGKWLVEELSRVNTNELNDEFDGFVMYRGTAPIYITPQVVPPELYNHLWQLYSKAYEIAGISQMAATSAKPAGLNSGEAQRQYRDNQSERFLDKFDSWDQFILQNARIAHDCMRDLSEHLNEEGGLKVNVKHGNYLAEVDFGKVDILEENIYELQITPTSLIPTTPSGKIAFAEEMTNLGWCDPEELVEIIEMPDTERLIQRKLATRKLVEDMFDEMAETHEFQPPEPFMHWPVAIRVAVETYLVWRRDKADDDLLDLVSRWVVLARMQMKKEAAEDAPPPPPPPPGANMSQPGMMQPGAPPPLTLPPMPAAPPPVAA